MTFDYFILLKAELQICLLIFLLLLLKLARTIPNEKLLPIIQLLLLANFAGGFFYNQSGDLFDGMFTSNTLIHLQKHLLNLAVYLISLLFSGWFSRSLHLTEFFVLMLSALLGMFFLLSSGNLLIFYLSLELATIPIAAMANFDMTRKRSAEAAMKLILSAAFSSGILLFGISLIYGTTGSIRFPEIPLLLDGIAVQVMAFVFLVTAFAFKLSIVPFHLWTADVYEGSPASVTAFLSVVSKGVIAFAFLTFLYKVFQPFNSLWYHILMLLSILTIVAGNLFALRQMDMKRFLAFSSITQVGFILVAMMGKSSQSITAITYFVLIYVFSNLAAFGVMAIVAEHTGNENRNALKGLYKSNPFLSWVLALAMFSLAGIPPTAGFFGKLFLITAGASTASYGFIIFVALNLVVSLYYYLLVVKNIFMDDADEQQGEIPLSAAVKLGLILCTAGILLTGLFSWVYDYIATQVM
jgi:NADH-quinone oxidoreductase subunit N